MGLAERDPLAQLSLPPGFRFYPTDEELMVQYLCRKVAGHEFPLQIIGDIDLYKFDPWVLPSLAMFGEKEWYFFSPRDRKYPNGSRPNRVAGSGYWKATGTDKIITTQGRKVGIKKALVFYIGKAPKGTKTNWIMHEYRLSDPQRKHGSSKLDEWVLCRIYKKNGSASSTKQLPTISSPNCTSMSSPFTGGSGYGGSSPSSSSHIDSFLESMPDQLPDHDLPLKTDDKLDDLLKVGSGNFDWEALLGLTTTPELNSHTQQGRTGQRQQIQQSSTTQGNNNFPVTSLPPLRQVDDEVQSGIKNAHPVNNNNQFPQSSAGVIDPFGIIQYPNQSYRYGFRQ